MTTIELQEHVATRHPRPLLTYEQGAALHAGYSKFVDVQFPTPRTFDRWELMSKGYVGAIALDRSTKVIIRPKVPIANIARMIALVYDLELSDFQSLLTCGTLLELYEQLASILAGRVLRLMRQGPLSRYRAAVRDVSAVRGRIDMGALMRSTVTSSVRCHFSERTMDVLEHQILLWTLSRVLRSGLASDRTQRSLRESYRQLLNVASIVPLTARDCDNVQYDRLSERYRPAVALCRLLLEGAGPVPEEGGATTVPFLLEMPLLFERFVARWLATALAPEYLVQSQERRTVGLDRQVEFFIDLVLYEARTGRAICVLDTKYKDVTVPAASDVAQVGYYALLKEAPLAGLIFPVGVQSEWTGDSGKVRTFRATFDLSLSIDESGERVRKALLQLFATAAGKAVVSAA